MAEAFTIRQNDTLPIITATLCDADGNAVNLTGATVVFTMYRGVTSVLSRAAALSDAAAGIVTFTWQAGDTATAGTHGGYFTVTFSGGAIETFPNSGRFQINITT